MTSQEIELWAREIIEIILGGSRSEDSRVELKAEWHDAEKAAKQLAAHANSARGQFILWLIGIDEKAQRLTDIQVSEMSDWWNGVTSRFDGFPPRLEQHVNFRFENKKLVALYFSTSHESPYVVRHGNGGSYPQFVVPWREGTLVRAARRDELLRILVPTQNLLLLKNELDFNLSVSTYGRAVVLFRTQEFNSAMLNGTLPSLGSDLRTKIIDAYIKMEYANRLVNSSLNMPPLQDLYPGAAFQEAQEAVKNAVPLIRAAYDALSDARVPNTATAR